MKRLLVVAMLFVVAVMLLSTGGCATTQEGLQVENRWPQWRPCWAREGRWDPHWVKNEPYRPWPL